MSESVVQTPRVPFTSPTPIMRGRCCAKCKNPFPWCGNETCRCHDEERGR
jgi:hypothetical protein